MATPTVLRRLRRVRDPVLDVIALAVSVAAMVLEVALSDETNVTPVAVGVIVVGCLPVLVRRRAPAAAFIISMALLFALMHGAGIYNAIAIPAMLCAYTLAAAHGRRAAGAAAVFALPVVIVILQVYSPHAVLTWDTAKNIGFVAVPLTLGVAAHDRRAYTAALVERAESAERTREEEALRRVGDERLRIARDIHDTVAHAMVAINVQAGVGAHLLERDPAQARATLRDIKKLSGESLADLRSMLGPLRDENAEDTEGAAPTHPTQGIAEIDALRAGLGSAGIDLDVTIDPATNTLPTVIGATGYRIVQEALTNVLRHVGPTSARVCVERRDNMLVIEIENDKGHGPTPLNGAGSGNGLRGMRERAAAMGGSLEAGPRDDGGWRVAASLPVSAS